MFRMQSGNSPTEAVVNCSSMPAEPPPPGRISRRSSESRRLRCSMASAVNGAEMPDLIVSSGAAPASLLQVVRRAPSTRTDGRVCIESVSATSKAAESTCETSLPTDTPISNSSRERWASIPPSRTTSKACLFDRPADHRDRILRDHSSLGAAPLRLREDSPPTGPRSPGRESPVVPDSPARSERPTE